MVVVPCDTRVCNAMQALGSQVKVTRRVRVAAQPDDRPTVASRTNTMRMLLDLPGIHKGPACFDGLSAKLIEQEGFPFAFMSGFSVAAARLGYPDTGLLSYQEMLDQGRNLLEATTNLPVIADGDTGYGNPMNVQRTVRGFAQAGFAGVLLEDQQWPKSCGHVRDKRVVDRQEAAAKIRAAVEARVAFSDAGADLVLVARTDARQAQSLDEALWRAAAFADQGADVLFIDALESVQEMEAFCRIAPGVPKMASMLEGGGKTPMLSPAELEDMGFKLVAYPLSLIGVSMRAMQLALQQLKRGEVPSPPAMPSFQEVQEVVGFPQYWQAAERFAAAEPLASSSCNPDQSAATAGGVAGTAVAGGVVAAEASAGKSATDNGQQPASSTADSVGPSNGCDVSSTADAAPSVTDSTSNAATAAEQGGDQPDDAEFARRARAAALAAEAFASASIGIKDVVEADEVIAPPAPRGARAGARGSSGAGSSAAGASNDESVDDRVLEIEDMFRKAKFFRIRIEDTATGKVKLETRLPATFLQQLPSMIPEVTGFTLKDLIEAASGKADWAPDKPIIDFSAGGGDKVLLYLDDA